MADGLVVVDKAAGWTSHDVVAKLRGTLGTRKIGHAGTLDPDATGVLVVGIGRMTRLLRFLVDASKEYRGEVVLGVATSTLDASGDRAATWDMSSVTLDDTRAAAASLTGDIDQIPPMVSAVQVGGRRLHELARRGIEVERAPRPVHVERFDIDGWSEPGVLSIDVECSAGTYVRTLAADLGTALGGGAHLRGLRRTRAGSFTLVDAKPLESVDESSVVPMAQALGHLTSVQVENDVVREIANGRVLPPDRLGLPAEHGGGPWAVVDSGGELLAVYEPRDSSTVKPAVVVAR